jgi:hypothetical protein
VLIRNVPHVLNFGAIAGAVVDRVLATSATVLTNCLKEPSMREESTERPALAHARLSTGHRQLFVPQQRIYRIHGALQLKENAHECA